MQQTLRRRATGSQNNDSTEEEHAEDKKFSEFKTVLWRCLHAIYGMPKKLLDQDYESVQAILLNFGIVAALLLSILLSLILTVPVEETVRGDICPCPALTFAAVLRHQMPLPLKSAAPTSPSPCLAPPIGPSFVKMALTSPRILPHSTCFIVFRETLEILLEHQVILIG